MKKITMTKRGKLTLLGILIVIVLILLGVSFLKKAKGADADATSLAGVPSQGVEDIADYHLIPILNVQATGTNQVYLNTAVTPALFFATWSEQSQKEVAAIQEKINAMKSLHKPLVLISTFVKTTDQSKAVEDAKEFQQKNKITLPMTVQVGPPTEFVKQVPSLVYTDQKGTHIITNEDEIMKTLDSVLSIQKPQKVVQPSAKK
jgi:low affinity Fe/Cu permease